MAKNFLEVFPTLNIAESLKELLGLVQVEKVTDEEMEQWKRDYPEAFARKIDPDAGVCLAGWLVDEKEAE